MNVEIALYIISGLLSILSIMAVLLGFFMKRVLTGFDLRFESLTLSIDGIKSGLDQVISKVTVQETKSTLEKLACGKTHKEIEIQFNKQEQTNKEIEKRIDDCEKSILVLGNDFKQ